MAPPVPMKLIEEADTKEEEIIARAIQNLVDEKVEAAAAAKEITDTIIAETEHAKEPDAVGWQYYLWDCLGTSGMDVPATHPSQARLVDLFRELQQLPKSQNRQKYRHKPSIQTKELWTLTPANNYDGFEQWLWDLNEGRFVGGRQVEESEDAARKYLNFSAFLARLLAAEQVEAIRFSALMRPSPFAMQDLSADSAKKYGAYVSAAAQWIKYAGNALFEMCEKDTPVDFNNQSLTRDHWSTWKETFAKVAKNEVFGSETQDNARAAVKEMSDIESKGITTSVTKKFGLIEK